MSKSKPLVIVLSRNYSTGLGVIRSLGAAGYIVDLIASVKKQGSSVICSCSRYVRNSVEVLDYRIQGNSGDGIINEIMKYAITSDDKIVLFPADDFTASIIANNYDKLAQYFLMPNVIGDYPASLIEAMDKSVQSKLAKAAGLNTPLEWTISLKGAISIPDDIVYPCFVKPCQSVAGSKSEMKVCNSLNELENHLNDMQEFFSDREVIVQEYLNIDKEYDLSGVCIDQEIIIPAVIEKTRIAKFEPGVTMSGVIVDKAILGDELCKMIEMLKAFRYIGMFDMELFLCNGKLYFNELNLRSGGPNYSYYLNGVNLPDIFVKEITGKGHDSNEEMISSYGKSFVYEKVAWEDYIHSYMTKQELNDCIKGSDFTLLASKEDPAPGDRFFKRIRLSAIKHKALMAIGKE